MNKKIWRIVGVYSLIVLGVTLLFFLRFRGHERMQQSERENMKVIANEISQAYQAGDVQGIDEVCDRLRQMEDKEKEAHSTGDGGYNVIWVVAAVNIILMFLLALYLYQRILKPFKQMEEYASQVASGNLGLPLKMDRGNFFGEFTWAFDTMRKEIVKSREAEKNAIENNKIVIASLSHDIKTPVASIRAYAEAFEANLYSSPEKKQKYLSTIMNKCDEVSKLTNDLFNHSLTQMNKLEVKTERIELNSFVREKIVELFVNPDDVEVKLTDEEICVDADPKRLQQIAENLINNTAKYAKTSMEIFVESDSDFVKLHFRDFGTGIPEDEIPFIKGKFYRGKNVGDENGSGLGLYIVDELARKMGGKVELYNKAPGLDVVICLKKTEKETGKKPALEEKM